MSEHFKIVTERLITLAWNDVEPKVKAALASGTVVTGVELIAAAYGFPVPGVVDAILVLLATTAAGYIKKSAIRIPPAPPKVPLPGPDDIAAEKA